MSSMPQYSDLQGKVAIVTGANGDIGRTIAALLSENGADVVGLDKKVGKSDGAKFSDVVSSGELVLGDVTKRTDVTETIEIAESYGEPEIAINNAGIPGNGNINSVSIDKWQRSFAVHVEGTYNICRGILPKMVKNSKGSIINISSIAGATGYGSAADYSAAKGAVISLSRQLAVDYSQHNVRINTIVPGFIKTEMNEQVWKHEESKSNWINKELAQNKTLLPRLGVPADVANLVTFLSSDTSSFITGQTIATDGGWTAW